MCFSLIHLTSLACLLPQTHAQSQTQAQSKNCSCPVEARGLSGLVEARGLSATNFQPWPTGEGCQGGAECRYWHALSVALDFHHHAGGRCRDFFCFFHLRSCTGLDPEKNSVHHHTCNIGNLPSDA